MYPDWPKSAADLVPLPHCNGPKLKPFACQCPQKIEFLEYLGEGLHAHVVKVRIMGQVYTLKLFRFVYDDDWLGPADHTDPNDLEAMSAFYDYSEPFSCECRAFGRLQEAGHEELAVRCFGYLLLDEEHERALMNQFSHLNLEFNGNIEYPGAEDMRSRFLGEDGRPPPIRGIVKEFGQGNEDLRVRDARRILRNIIQLQQLGIIHIDVARRQFISGKFSDFSTALTVPHFVTNPELNPSLTPEWISAVELEAFQFSVNDYWEFDEMVRLWNEEHENRKDKISVYAFPGGHGYQIKYEMRSTLSRERVYSFVDPRLYEKRTPATNGVKGATGALDGRKRGRKAKCSSHGKSKREISKNRWRLDASPRRWYYDCESEDAIRLKGKTSFSTSLTWAYEDGLIFPLKKG